MLKRLIPKRRKRCVASVRENAELMLYVDLYVSSCQRWLPVQRLTRSLETSAVVSLRVAAGILYGKQRENVPPDGTKHGSPP